MNDEMHYLRDQYDDACRRIRQLTSGPGGIMEMKQTIADTEKQIAELERELLEWKSRAISMFNFIPDEVTAGEVQKARNEVLKSLKNTILPGVDKEKEIEELKTALRQCYDALEVAFDYDGDDVFGMLHNAAVDASMEAERLLEIKR